MYICRPLVKTALSSQ